MDLKQYREEINEIDARLTELFNERMRIALGIASYKQANDIPIVDKKRERDVMEKAAESSDPEIADYTRILYSDIFSLSRAYQHRVITGHAPLTDVIRETVENTPRLFPEKAAVACQGVEGAYSQHACDRIFRYPKVTYYDTWESVFEAVKDGKCEYGILPIENSTAGSVNKVYDLMKSYSFHIVRSIRLRVDHALLAKAGTRLGQIKEIFSHEQAINQCAGFLRGLDGVKVTVAENTAAAAKMVAESGRNDVAAIASGDCAELYSLEEIASGIQNVKNNYTRFICISAKPEIYPGANRTSIMITTLHKPGALYGVMSKFNAHGINLLKLESRPIPERDFEFSFYFDLEASVYSDDLYALIDELYAEGYSFTYFGSYSEIL